MSAIAAPRLFEVPTVAPTVEALVPGHVMLVFQPAVGGVPQYVSNLAEGLSDLGWTVTVAAPSDTPFLGRLAGVAREVIALDTTAGLAPLDDLRLVRQLAGLCRQREIDLIHAHSSKAGALAAVVGRMAGIPSVYSPHGWSFQRELSSAAERAYVTAERFLARRHAHLIAVGEVERLEAERRGVGDRAMELIHTGLHDMRVPDREHARAELGLDPDAFVVGWVGRVGAQKRSEDLPVLARELGDEATVVALGYGIPQSEPGRALVELGGKALSGSPAELVYGAADALVLTSRWEGLPLVVLEAMRAGLPVVSYDIGGVRDQVCHGETGYLVPAGDVGALAGALTRLARDSELVRQLGNAGRGRFLQLFGFKRMVTRIERAYERVLREKDGSGAPVARASARPAASGFQPQESEVA
jgi:glycosyltransferase involved in cell wall biosynthesis